MKKYRLSRDVEFTFQQIHTVRAKKDTRVIGSNGHFILSPSQVETDTPTGPRTIWAHDTKYYYIWAPADAVEEVPDAAS